MRTTRRFSCLALFLLICQLFPATVFGQQGQENHPLAIHMNQWLVGSREWTTPNPHHDPQHANSYAEFRVRWDWDSFNQQLLGKLFGVTEDGKTALFWNMYTTYNPATKTVVFQQIGWNGAYIHGEHPAREKPVAYGETERLDTTMYGPDGSIKETRHDNVFQEGSHQAKVYEQDENGEWQLARTWEWTLLPESEVLGTSL